MIQLLRLILLLLAGGSIAVNAAGIHVIKKLKKNILLHIAITLIFLLILMITRIPVELYLHNKDLKNYILYSYDVGRQQLTFLYIIILVALFTDKLFEVRFNVLYMTQ